MKLLAPLSCLLLGSIACSHAAAQAFFQDFALVVQLPDYDAVITNLGSSPIRVDGYSIGSASGSLSQANWARLGAAGPAVVAALGPGADQFVPANPTANHLTELNLASSATWQPGQSWSIGFPFDSNAPDFILDAVFQFSSPDGFVLTGGTVVPPGELAPAALLVVPEPAGALLFVVAAMGFVALRVVRRGGDMITRAIAR